MRNWHLKIETALPYRFLAMIGIVCILHPKFKALLHNFENSKEGCIVPKFCIKLQGQIIICRRPLSDTTAIRYGLTGWKSTYGMTPYVVAGPVARTRFDQSESEKYFKLNCPNILHRKKQSLKCACIGCFESLKLPSAQFISVKFHLRVSRYSTSFMLSCSAFKPAKTINSTCTKALSNYFENLPGKNIGDNCRPRSLNKCSLFLNLLVLR